MDPIDQTLVNETMTSTTSKPNKYGKAHDCIISINQQLSGGFQYVFIFIPKIGEDEPILTCAYFSNGLVKTHPLVYDLFGNITSSKL